MGDDIVSHLDAGENAPPRSAVATARATVTHSALTLLTRCPDDALPVVVIVAPLVTETR